MSPLEEAAIAEVEKPSIQQADVGGRRTEGDYDAPSSVGREVRAAAIGTLAALALAAAASSGAMLSGAVTAQGSVVLDGSVKRIQNPSGGVVESIPVRDGDRVVKG